MTRMAEFMILPDMLVVKQPSASRPMISRRTEKVGGSVVVVVVVTGVLVFEWAEDGGDEGEDVFICVAVMTCAKIKKSSKTKTKADRKSAEQ